MTRFRALAVAVVLAASSASSASGADPSGMAMFELAAFETAPATLAAIPGRPLEVDLVRDGRNGTAGRLFGELELRAPVTVDSHGTLSQVAGGDWVWRLTVRAPGATELGVVLSRFNVPQGSSLWLLDPAGTMVQGPYRRADRLRNGRLRTASVPGDEAIVEVRYRTRAAARHGGVEIAAIHYDRRANTPPSAAVCRNQTLCLVGGRFEVAATWFNQFNGRSGAGKPATFTDVSGYFTFEDPANVELIVKVLDYGDGLVKVFYGQLTDLRFTLTVRDTVTGREKFYVNPPSNCGAIDQSYYAVSTPIVLAANEDPAKSLLGGSCVSSPNRLCLLDNRYAVEVAWRNHYNGTSGQGSVASLSNLTGTVHYGDPRNIELLVKVLDFGNQKLLFYGALSDLEYTITLTDTQDQSVRQYSNPGGSYCGGADPSLGGRSGNCYLDTLCSSGDVEQVRDAGSGLCVPATTCANLWECASGPTTGSCNGGETACVFSSGCTTDSRRCSDGVCTSLAECSDRFHFANDPCPTNEPSGVCYLDTTCSTNGQNLVRDFGSRQCVASSSCTALWECLSGPSTGSCNGGPSNCQFNSTCPFDVARCTDGSCSTLTDCKDRVFFANDECPANQANGICYLDSSCPQGVRDSGSRECVQVETCSVLWECAAGPTTQRCDGGTVSCAINPACPTGAARCEDDTCAATAECSDRLHFANDPCSDEPGVGALSFRLIWSGEDDLDLFVREPSTEVIYYAARTSATGGNLDVDCNAACSNPCPSPIENIFWSFAGAPRGSYEFWVDHYSDCDDSGGTTPGRLEVRQGNTVVQTYDVLVPVNGESTRFRFTH